MRIKEIKDYGTKKSIEGVFEPGQKCLVIEDLITSGTSIIETIAPLEAEGLRITDAVVLIDREQGGRTRLAEKGYRLHSLFCLSEALDILQYAHKLDFRTVSSVKQFIRENQVKPVTGN